MQFYLFLPLFVILFMKKRLVFRILYSFMIAGGAAIIFTIWYVFELNAGILSLEDFFLFTIDIQKPFTKILAAGFGLMLVDFHIYFKQAQKTNF